jgi:hypothetical protein
MKSCRCNEINPENLTKCLKPWGHDDSDHQSESIIWKVCINVEKNKKENSI